MRREQIVHSLKVYAQFVKLEHTLFSLPLIYAGSILAADGWPTWRVVSLILIAATAARTVALGLNRIIDRRIDAQNPRTHDRELPAGRLSVLGARRLVGIATLIYVGSAVLLGRICVYYAPIPLILFVIYPYLKRVTFLAHLGLGITWAIAPLGGWLAVAQNFQQSSPVWMLALFACLWVTGFDIIYATLDEASDKAQGLHSLPVAIGHQRALNVALGLHLASFLALTFLYRLELRGGLSFGLLLFAGLLLLIEHLKRDEVEFAFFEVNTVLGFVVLGLVIAGVANT